MGVERTQPDGPHAGGSAIGNMGLIVACSLYLVLTERKRSVRP